MKKTIISSLLLLLCAFSCALYAQNISVAPIENGGEYLIGKNDAHTPCITPEQYKLMEQQNAENCKRSGIEHGAYKSTTTSLNWPLRMANGLNDCSYYFISNYVDQDTTAGLKDWNCGAVTYNGHRGK